MLKVSTPASSNIFVLLPLPSTASFHRTRSCQNCSHLTAPLFSPSSVSLQPNLHVQGQYISTDLTFFQFLSSSPCRNTGPSPYTPSGFGAFSFLHAAFSAASLAALCALLKSKNVKNEKIFTSRLLIPHQRPRAHFLASLSFLEAPSFSHHFSSTLFIRSF